MNLGAQRGDRDDTKLRSLTRLASIFAVRTILLTGMSGTGKTTALAELERRGYKVVDTDDDGWGQWSDADGGYVWREDRMEELLTRQEASTPYISGTVSNQGRFYPRFDTVVLLPRCFFGGSVRGRRTTTGRATRIATSSCATWTRLNLCYAQPALTKSTRHRPST